MHLSNEVGDAAAAYLATSEDAHDQEIFRLTVRLTGDALKTVRALAKKRGISIKEFMRRAVSTEAFIQEQTANGANILVEDRHGRRVRSRLPG